MNYMRVALCFKKHPETIQQTIIDRQNNEELMDVVLEFLLSLQDK
jgi:hypothetical protein